MVRAQQRHHVSQSKPVCDNLLDKASELRTSSPTIPCNPSSKAFQRVLSTPRHAGPSTGLSPLRQPRLSRQTHQLRWWLASHDLKEFISQLAWFQAKRQTQNCKSEVDMLLQGQDLPKVSLMRHAVLCCAMLCCGSPGEEGEALPRALGGSFHKGADDCPSVVSQRAKPSRKMPLKRWGKGQRERWGAFRSLASKKARLRSLKST